MARRKRGVFEAVKGSGVWWINYYDAEGKRHREPVGPYKLAEQAYLQRQMEVRAGKFQAPRTPKAETLKFGALVEAALADMKTRVSEAHYSERCYQWGKLQRYSLGAKTFHPEKPAADSLAELPVRQVTAAVLSGVLQRLREDGAGPATANKYRAFFCNVFSHALLHDQVAANPVLKIKKYKEPVGRTRFLSEPEEAALRAVIQKDCPEREVELDLAMFSGMRRGEQFRLARFNVDYDRGVMLVDGKSGPREVEMNSASRQALEELCKRFVGSTVTAEHRTDRGRQRDWRRWFEECVRGAGLVDFHWHDLRHTFASRLVMAGVDLRTVQELLGHKDIRMTMRYAHLTKNHRAKAAEQIVPSKSEKAKRSGFRIVRGTNKTGTGE